jgi:hypothetical protein
VSVAVCAEVTLPANAEKVAVVAPEGRLTLAGTVTAALLLDRATGALPDAALLRVTIQLDVAPAVIADGLQLNEVTCVGGLTVTMAWASPP